MKVATTAIEVTHHKEANLSKIIQFATEAARQGRLLAEWEASPAGREEMAFWDALASEAWNEPD